ncbi:MAG: PhzF family phenazine biosynthesis protein [Pseudomonadota bacterium]
MASYPIYQVDAFTSKIFGGNPAAVVPLEQWLPDDVMQNIAIENNLSETAFFIPDSDNFYLRWFTPTFEIDLCGHATLATSHVILNELYPDRERVEFNTNVAGKLIVAKDGDKLTMDFPNRPGEPVDISDIPECVIKGIGGIQPVEVYKARDLMLVFEKQDIVESIEPNFSALMDYPHSVCVTAPADKSEYDFVSRFFCARDLGIPEDPVTGSAHCTLTPFWADRLGKNKLKARQVSARGGDLDIKLQDDRIFISGQTKLFLKGEIYL